MKELINGFIEDLSDKYNREMSELLKTLKIYLCGDTLDRQYLKIKGENLLNDFFERTPTIAERVMIITASMEIAKEFKPELSEEEKIKICEKWLEEIE